MSGIDRLEGWFAQRNWQPFPFQHEVWQAYLEGKSGLLHSATGTGKTLAVWLGPVAEALDSAGPCEGHQVLWITPLRALASDTVASLKLPVNELGLNWEVQSRTGDTTSSERTKQKNRPPQALVTTPESLSLMIGREDAPELLKNLKLIVVDEWHELMGSKRGVMTELCLARVRALAPQVRTWGLSATLGNLTQALDSLVGANARGTLIQGELKKELVIDSVLPESVERFPWSGHFGTQMIPAVIEALEEGKTSLIFCNTRSQCEIWYQTLLQMRPEWKSRIALHHGSLSPEERFFAEEGLKNGALKVVVCTSSLDLGVDFTPVDRVLQIGSPKGVARLLQRAGRSGHRPGVPSRVTCVPTHALEMIDIASARRAAELKRIESRLPLERSLDVLVQHLVTVALGTGFQETEMLAEVRSTKAFESLSDAEWAWTLDFVVRGGSSLRAYAEYRRVVEVDGIYRVTDKEIAQRHRISIGTIVSDGALTVQYVGGSKLGTVEESFLSRLNKGDRFVFSGKILEFVQIRDMTALVKKAASLKGAVPRWAGGRLPLSNELATTIRETLERVRDGELFAPELACLGPLLNLQARWSAIPRADEVLVERVESREGHHLFFYLLEGRSVHEGLAALFAHRISKLGPITFSIACNDYGLELLSEVPAPLELALEQGLFEPEGLQSDIWESLNSGEMAKRQFREIARIAGLVFQGYPGQAKRSKQLQASSALFYDVFARYEPDNLLLNQSQREVLDRQLDTSRLAQTLRRVAKSRLLITQPERPTPFAFPILVDRLRDTVSSESFAERMQRMVVLLEEAAGE